jgi:hypothetical protein
MYTDQPSGDGQTGPNQTAHIRQGASSPAIWKVGLFVPRNHA